MSESPTLPSIAILGFGTMGKALAAGLLAGGITSRDNLRIGVRRPHPGQSVLLCSGWSLVGLYTDCCN